MNISRTHHVALFTANFERIRDFYTTVLGFPIVGRIPGRNILFVDCGSTAIEIVEDTTRAASGGGGGWAHLALEVDDIDAVYTELAAADVPFHLTPTSFPEDDPLLRIAFFRDPDGNELELFKPFGTRYPQ